MAITAAATAVAAAVALLIAFWPLHGGSAPAAGSTSTRLPASADRGRIVVRERSGDLALADPDGMHVTRLRSLTSEGQMVSAALDGKYLSLGNGQTAVVRTGPTVASYSNQVTLSNRFGAAYPDAFADHDQYLVMLEDSGQLSYASGNPVQVVSLATGASATLGTGADAAGDPQTAGAFVSVLAPPVSSAAPEALPPGATVPLPDTEVDLEDAGKPPVVLATAVEINNALGLVNNPVALTPYPDAAGDKIAVRVISVVYGGGQVSGVVVLTRSGTVLGAVTSQFAPGALVWSPDGTALAFFSSDSASGQVLSVWKPGQHPATARIPRSDTNDVFCVWSPDGASILCGGDAAPAGLPGSGKTPDWLVFSAAGRRVAAVPGIGRPLAWLPGGRAA